MNQPHPNNRPPEWSPAELTQATNRHARASDLPPAAQPLHAGFLALGAAVERAAPAVDSAALLARLRERLSDTDHNSPPCATAGLPSACATAGLPSSAPSQSAPAQQSLGRLLLALAASLLLGMAIIGHLRTPTALHVASNIPRTPQAEPTLPETAPPERPAPETIAGVESASEPGWDDLDDEISAAATAIRQLRWGSARVDASLEGFQQRLFEMNAEVSSTSL